MKTHFFVHAADHYQQLRIDSVLYVEANDNKSTLYLADGVCHVDDSLTAIERIFPPAFFCRPRPDCLVAFHRVVSFDNTYLYLPDKKILFDPHSKKAFLKTMPVCLHRSEQAGFNSCLQ